MLTETENKMLLTVDSSFANWGRKPEKLPWFCMFCPADSVSLMFWCKSWFQNIVTLKIVMDVTLLVDKPELFYCWNISIWPNHFFKWIFFSTFSNNTAERLCYRKPIEGLHQNWISLNHSYHLHRAQMFFRGSKTYVSIYCTYLVNVTS